jgi:DNA-binding transcriptional LysR family regulator
MDIEEIRTFVSIAKVGGFSRAAGQLHRSQPAISRRIGLLEQELGAPLFERQRGGVTLTAAGRAFLPFAESMLAAIRDGRDAVGASMAEESGTVSLALVGTLTDTHIVDVLRKFASRSRGAASLELRTANSQGVGDLVRRGEATLGLKYHHATGAEFTSTVIAQEQMIVICAAEHPLAGTRVRPLDLRGERWITFPPVRDRESFGTITERRLHSAGLDTAPMTIIDSLTAQKRFVEAGFGIALVPESCVRAEIKLGIIRKVDAPSVSTQVPVALIYRRKGYLNAVASALIAILTEMAPKRKNNAR